MALSNAVLSNNALSNAVLSNVALSNSALNVALTNLDPQNVALSNVVLSNNELTNVALSNNALSNAMLSNAVLSNVALSNVALSNAALSNNALSNNVLSNVVLSNAPLADSSTVTDADADPLRTIEVSSPEIAKNGFATGDVTGGNNTFKETSFTVRNRGNTDTMVSIKLLVRDAICTGASPPSPQIPFTCTPPPGYKLQLILRKVSLVPMAIPPTNPAVSTGQTYRIGLVQTNAEVSNVADLPLVDPTDPNFGRFLPDDPNAATLSLGAGEYAYATIRAIGTGGTSPPDPADLLRWGIKAVSSNATTTTSPLIITSVSFPPTPGLFVALQPAPVSTKVTTFGGTGAITGAVACSDKDGNPVLTGAGAPAAAFGAVGNWYIDVSNSLVYGQKTLAGWGGSQPLIQITPRPGDPQTGPHAILPCPLPPAAVAVGAFTTTGQVSAAPLTFTPTYWGDFYTRLAAFDATSSGTPLQPKDQQVIKVHVEPANPQLAFNPPTLTYNQTRALSPFDAATAVSTNSPVPRTFVASGPACQIAADGHTLTVLHATATPSDCVVTVSQVGNETYAPASVTKSITINKADQAITVTSIPADNQLTYNTGGLPFTLAGTVASTTAPDSGFAVTFSSTTPAICTTGGTFGQVVTITGAGTCTINFDQAGNGDYKAAPTVQRSFLIAKADQAISSRRSRSTAS